MAVVREQTAGRGVDVVLDMVGGAYFARNLDALATEGRLVEIATLHGAKAEVNIQTIMQRRLTITGSTLRARPVADKGAIAAAVRHHVWPLLESGAVKPIIHATFPLREAAEAHRLMESSAHIGKLVLTILNRTEQFLPTPMLVAEWAEERGVMNGKLTESAFEVLARARALEKQGRSIIHLEIGEPDFPTPRYIVAAGTRALEDGWTKYGPTAGFPEFREAIAAYVHRELH